MSESIDIVVLGDARVETRQTAPDAAFPDNEFTWGRSGP